MADLTRHEQFLNHIAHPDEPCPKPQTRTEFLLKEIAENKDEAALPPVTAADNGDVLTVVNGAWGKGKAHYSVSYGDAETVVSSQSVATEDYNGYYVATVDCVNQLKEDAIATVVFDSASYTLPVKAKHYEDSAFVYIGELDSENMPIFDNYPFAVVGIADETFVDFYTTTEATHTFAITQTPKVVTPSDDFKSAVAASGGVSGNAAWNAMMNHMVFVMLEARSSLIIDVFVQCSDGITGNTWSAEQDLETGDWSYSFGEWMTDPEYPVPNLEDYTATLERNLGPIIEDAFSESHDAEDMNYQVPIVVCRKFVYPWD